MPDSLSPTIDGKSAQGQLIFAWFAAHENQPMPEGRAEVERLLAMIVDAAYRDLLDEVETICEDNGQNAIRTDDLAAMIRGRTVR